MKRAAATRCMVVPECGSINYAWQSTESVSEAIQVAKDMMAEGPVGIRVYVFECPGDEPDWDSDPIALFE